MAFLLTVGKMTFLSCFCFVTFTSASTGILTQVRKMVTQTEPLVLLWGGRRPPDLNNRACWMSKYTGPAHRGRVSVALHSNWIENPDSDEARRKKKSGLMYCVG
ncbi:uncharacterized protein [Dermacentor albipictus]|uniref:uncharacterized protein n=1 Tax=Dermacentor albipictus TaxID=60249 RepID=UPI0038FC26F0